MRLGALKTIEKKNLYHLQISTNVPPWFTLILRFVKDYLVLDLIVALY